MTREDIIRMAREAGIERDDDFAFDESDSGVIYYIHPGTLERFAALVAAAEREACAKVCDVTPPYPFRPSIEAAHAIRARSKE